MLIYGHRGASSSEPENTLRAFRRALEMGVDGLEIDVQATRDRVPVILHDRNLDRTTNGRGPIDHRTLAEVRKLDAGQGERIPTLDEVLDLVGDRAHIDIEIKQGGIEREVLDTLARHPRARWAISSFDWVVLERIRALSPDADLWVLAVLVSNAMFHAARHLNASAIALQAGSITEASAKRIQEAGLKVAAWTVNDVAEAARVAELGVHGLCTGAPDLILSATCAPPGTQRDG